MHIGKPATGGMQLIDSANLQSHIPGILSELKYHDCIPPKHSTVIHSIWSEAPGPRLAANKFSTRIDEAP